MMLDKIQTHIRWWRATREKNTFASFANALKQVCLLTNPQNILEFGPGFSTNLFLKYTKAKIISFETNPHWYNKYSSFFPTSRTTIVFKEPNWDLSEIKEYGDTFSLVMIDGGNRVDELIYSFDLIDENGLVFLHDAHREDYEPGIRRYPYIYLPERHSCILFKSKQLRDRIKENIPPDYSCNCQYCSSDARREYFNKLLELSTQ